MTKDRKYKVVVSDRAKRMLGAHIRFIGQVNKEAAAEKKKELMAAMRSLTQMPQRYPFFEETHITPNKYHKMFVENGIWFFIKYQTIEYISNIYSIVGKITAGSFTDSRMFKIAI